MKDENEEGGEGSLSTPDDWGLADRLQSPKGAAVHVLGVRGLA